MNKEFVASELVAVAKDLASAQKIKADFGDVPSYHNVFDYFDPDGRKLSRDEVYLLQGILEEALSQSRRQCSALVRKSILSNSADLKTLAKYGIKVR